MNSPPRLPDLEKLSDVEKNQLIISLYDTLLAIEGGRLSPATGTAAPGAVERTSDDVASLRDRIARSAPSRRMQTSAPPAPSIPLRVLNSRPLQLLFVILAIGFAADFAIGWYQRRIAESETRAALELKSAAFDGLYVELVRVAYEPDGRTYRAAMTMVNSHPDAPLYVMMSPVRVFIQIGLTWHEVPSRSANGGGWGVVKLEGERDFSVLFHIDAKDWAELIPGYMHVRIDNQTLISRSSAPKDDIIERNNVFYVYLKPQGADDEAIKRRSNFPGTPPVFLPMPPH